MASTAAQFADAGCPTRSGRLPWPGEKASTRPFRSGFTLIELLVVITIIGTLMALLLPAVQGVREAGNRIKCCNNLKQLALAISTYETIHGVLPPSGMVDKVRSDESTGCWRTEELRRGQMFSWIVLILPQIEQQQLYWKFDFEKNVLQQPNDPQAVQLPILLCPSDSARGKFFVDSQLTGRKRFAKGNYAAYVSPFHTDLQSLYPGALIWTGQKTASIRDGLSNTIMLSEVLARDHEQDQRGAWALPWTGASLLAFDMHQDWFGAPGVYTGSPWSKGLTQPPNNQGPNMDMLYACPDMAGAQLDRMPCNTWASSGVECFLSAAPRSRHPGGVNVAFMDGRVMFLPNQVDEYAMAYMVSINDSKAINVSEHVR